MTGVPTWASRASIARGQDTYGTSLCVYDPSHSHRYLLTREWDATAPVWAVCMLNPSSADEFKLDPTVTRVVRRAQADGAGSVLIVNLFALRSTDPRQLYTHRDPAGPLNDKAIAWASSVSDRFIVAWGNHGRFDTRADHVMGLLGNRDLERFGSLTKQQHPRHPLYLPSSMPFEVHRPAGS